MGRVKPRQGCPGSFGFPIPEVSKEFLGRVGTAHSLDLMALGGFFSLSGSDSMANLVPQHLGLCKDLMLPGLRFPGALE